MFFKLKTNAVHFDIDKNCIPSWKHDSGLTKDSVTGGKYVWKG
jgi:hypothetical protein